VSEPWTLVEPCCGSAALTLHLLGAQRPVVPYQGTKWRFRYELASLITGLGFGGRPERIVLCDVGPWGRVAPVVLDRLARAQVILHLRCMSEDDPRAVWNSLNGAAVPVSDGRYAAEYLFLQRLAFSGKAVAERNGRWWSPGFNASSAYGLPRTSRFGAVSPMVPGLIRVLESYDTTLADVAVSTSPEFCGSRVLVYLDPPYRGSTRYPCGDLPRHEVVAMARTCAEAGWTVLVSEAEPIGELVADGWSVERINAGRADTSPFRGKNPEWVTHWQSSGRRA